MPDNNENYLKLITSEHATKPKFYNYVKAFLDMLSPSVDNLAEFDVIFNLSSAQGDRLDKIGNLVGISRILPISNENVSSVLSDDMYRKVIKSKIYFNHWNGTREQLEFIFRSIFPGVPFSIVDNQDMTVTINVIDANATQEFITLLNLGYIVPKPSGVRYNYVVTDKPLFGWNSDTAFIKGWDEGVWVKN